jgi:hypothetical protein
MGVRLCMGGVALCYVMLCYAKVCSIWCGMLGYAMPCGCVGEGGGCGARGAGAVGGVSPPPSCVSDIGVGRLQGLDFMCRCSLAAMGAPFACVCVRACAWAGGVSCPVVRPSSAARACRRALSYAARGPSAAASRARFAACR